MNPFNLQVIPAGDPAFCNRHSELDELTAHALNKVDVVLFAPRRYGKTSLVERVRENLRREHGFVTASVDLLSAVSVEDVAHMVMEGVLNALHKKEPLMDKGKRFVAGLKGFKPLFNISDDGSVGLTVARTETRESDGFKELDRTMAEIGRIIEDNNLDVHIVFDEFQEITELRESKRIEAILRSHIQRQQASYFFLGSRRRILLDMFGNKNRPFYQSAVIRELFPLPEDETCAFLQDRFKAGGKTCSEDGARAVWEKTEGYPFYVQRVAYEAFEAPEKTVDSMQVDNAFERVAEGERRMFEAMLSGLSLQQKKVLKALARSPQENITSMAFTTMAEVPAATASQARNRLIELDYIEQRDNVWRLVDPVFAAWLSK